MDTELVAQIVAAPLVAGLILGVCLHVLDLLTR